MKLPIKIDRPKHILSRKQISSNALKVLYRLRSAGYEAYLVGGGVRDLLLDRKPKDFDVATDAYPEDVRKVFRNSRIIGRRFRLVHVYFEGEVVEVSTFRANVDQTPVKVKEEDDSTPLMIRSDNIYGSMEEDAWRRDFTMNALYYSVEDFSIVDYTGGMEDLNNRCLRMIGDPLQRYHEDPVRLLRAIRLAAKLNFKIHANTEEPLLSLRHLLSHVPSARLFDEFLKLFFEGNAWETYQRLEQYGYMVTLFPKSWEALQTNVVAWRNLVELAVKATDRRFHEGDSLNPGFLLAVFLSPALFKWLEEQEASTTKNHFSNLHAAFAEVLRFEGNVLAIPKRITAMISAIWMLQYHLIRRRKKRVIRIFCHRYFRAALDMLDLRMQAGEPYQEEVTWWREFQQGNVKSREKMIQEL